MAMANAVCRGCVERGWQGLRLGETGQRYHERTTAPGELEMIPCVADMKKPKKVSTWRTCPNCGSKATKIMSVNTGLFTCQICDHSYDAPKGKPRKRKQKPDDSWRYRDPPW